MSKVHEAMRSLDRMTPPEDGSALNNLVGALIDELANEVPDDPNLESVRVDLVAAGRSYESCKKKDLALRFYLTIRALLREYELLHQRLRKSEKERRAQLSEQAAESPVPEVAHAATEGTV